MKLIELEGIGPSNAGKLSAIGLETVEQLLKTGSTPKGRSDLADKAGISSGQILHWVNQADLMRVKGVGPEYAELLEAAGVDSCPELGHRRADNLVATMVVVNAEKHLTRRTPTETEVVEWIKQASKLPAAVSH